MCHILGLGSYVTDQRRRRDLVLVQLDDVSPVIMERRCNPGKFALARRITGALILKPYQLTGLESSHGQMVLYAGTVIDL
jgi:hypothetical protein